jgi:hypothetical protein
VDRRQLLKGRKRFVMRRLRFDRQQLRAKLAGMGYSRIEFQMFPVRSNQSYHEFVLATKSA